MTKRTAVFCLSAILFSGSAHAGFEYMPQARGNAPQYQQQGTAPQTMLTAEPPMPILPTEPVSAEPLPAPNTGNRVLSTQVSRAHPRRVAPAQTTAIRAPANQAFDSESVLDAAILGEPIVMAAAPANVPARGEEYIAINPYPLQNESGFAVHSNDVAETALEAGMMENSGLLRPVAIPGAKRTAKRHTAPEEQFEIASNDIPAEDVYSTSVEEVALAPPPRKPNVPPMVDSPIPLTASYTDAIGFGKELPLALALSQVVPAGYSYSFAQNVDAGATVSWEGGKPWNEVLNDMLAPSGMKAVIRSNQVVIQNG